MENSSFLANAIQEPNHNLPKSFKIVSNVNNNFISKKVSENDFLLKEMQKQMQAQTQKQKQMQKQTQKLTQNQKQKQKQIKRKSSLKKIGTLEIKEDQIKIKDFKEMKELKELKEMKESCLKVLYEKGLFGSSIEPTSKKDGTTEKSEKNEKNFKLSIGQPSKKRRSKTDLNLNLNSNSATFFKLLESVDFNNIKRVHTTHKLAKLDSKLINEDENLLELNYNKNTNEESIQVNLNLNNNNNFNFNFNAKEKISTNSRKNPPEIFINSNNNNIQKQTQLTWENPNQKAGNANMLSCNKVIDYVNNVSINNSISKKSIKLLSTKQISNMANSQNSDSLNLNLNLNKKKINNIELNSSDKQEAITKCKCSNGFGNFLQTQGNENLKLPPRHKKMHSRSLQSPNTLYPIYESEHTDINQLNSNYKLTNQFAYAQAPFGTLNNNSYNKLNPYLSMQCFYPVYNPVIVPSNVVPMYCGNQKNVNLFINSSRNTNIHSNLGNLVCNLKSNCIESDPISRRHNRLIQVRTNNNSVKQSSIKMDFRDNHVNNGRAFASQSRMTNYDEIQSVNSNNQILESDIHRIKNNDSKGLSDFNEYLNPKNLNLNLNLKEKPTFISKRLNENCCSSYKRESNINPCLGNNNSNESLIKTMNSNAFNNLLNDNVKADINSSTKNDLDYLNKIPESSSKNNTNENEIKKGVEFSITFGLPDKKQLESLSERFQRTKANLVNKMKNENNVKKAANNITSERSKEEILQQRREMMRPKSKANTQTSQNLDGNTFNLSNQVKKEKDNNENHLAKEKANVIVHHPTTEGKLNKKSKSNPPIELINRLIAGTKLKVNLIRFQRTI